MISIPSRLSRALFGPAGWLGSAKKVANDPGQDGIDRIERKALPYSSLASLVRVLICSRLDLRLACDCWKDEGNIIFQRLLALQAAQL